jgi:hypothetical protein
MNQIGNVDQIMNNIKEEINTSRPSGARIVGYLSDLRTKPEFNSLSDKEYYYLVGETFKSDPVFFMGSIYGSGVLRRRLYENVNEREMEKYILEKFSLYEGEQILFEDSGKIILEGGGGVNSVHGTIYVTNFRIIAQGKLSTKKGLELGMSDTIDLFTGGRAKRKSRKVFIEGSLSQELPCYGYKIKTRNHSGLQKKSDCIKFNTNVVEDISSVSRSQQFKGNRIVKIYLTDPIEEKINKLFELLRKDTNQIINTIRELLNMDLDQKRKTLEISSLLHPLEYFPSKGKIVSKLQSDEVHYFSDTDYIEIVKETYKLNPEFFMSSIYPKMMSWKYSKLISAINVRKEIKILIDQLSKGLPIKQIKYLEKEAKSQTNKPKLKLIMSPKERAEALKENEELKE